MYWQTSRLPYNLQEFGVFQKALSKIKIFKTKLVDVLYHKNSDDSMVRFDFIEKYWSFDADGTVLKG